MRVAGTQKVFTVPEFPEIFFMLHPQIIGMVHGCEKNKLRIRLLKNGVIVGRYAGERGVAGGIKPKLWYV